MSVKPESKLKKVDKDIEFLEEELRFTDDYSEVPPHDIVAYNELRSCADLFRMYENGQLDISPEFQRNVVWQNPAQTRLIDSFIKQLPIPSLCISLDYKTDKRLVIDGLQRISTIVKFLSSDDWRLSDLEDIDPRIAGKTVGEIRKSTNEIYERVQNLTIPVTVLRCDYTKVSHNNYLFTIFHRLNTGGIKLNNQEIRNCIYNGAFNSLLKSLTKDEKWKKFHFVKNNNSSRFESEEIVLRFFAFYDSYEDYNGKLAKFLNNYMLKNKNPDESFLKSKKNLFWDTLDIISRIFDRKPAGKFSKAILDGLFVGIGRNVDNLKSVPDSELKNLYDKFKNLEDFGVEHLKEGLSSKDKVCKRLSAAINIFNV